MPPPWFSIPVAMAGVHGHMFRMSALFLIWEAQIHKYTLAPIEVDIYMELPKASRLSMAMAGLMCSSDYATNMGRNRLSVYGTCIWERD